MSYCVYIHTNKVNGKKYVGITSQNPLERWRKGRGYKNSTKFYKAIDKYGWDGFSHEILLDGISQDEARAAEISLIRAFDTIRNGYNISEGGNETPKPRSKPVQQIDYKTGEVIAEFESMAQAAKVTGVPRVCISKVINKRQTLAGGFAWCYVGEMYTKRYKGRGTSKKIEGVDEFGNTIQFECIQDACNYLGVGNTAIHAAMRRDGKCCGWKWRYTNAGRV